MQNKGTDYIRRLLKDKTRLKRWRKMILCLSCVVVFCTVYALILPAITLERKTVCGQEEHSHTEECYSSDGQLTCGKTEHTHTESCYADDKTSEDQSGEDSQQTPEQNQTEGQEQNSGQSQEQNQNQNQDQSQSQNQVQTSDDGNVTQNGENGDTAGTTADETSGNDEESVVAGSTSAPAAEGEDGTGSTTTATKGFDLSESENQKNLNGVTLQYYDENSKKWMDIPESGMQPIPGNARIRLQVQYKDVPIDSLIKSYDCTLTYPFPTQLRDAVTGNVLDAGKKVVGDITVQDGKIVVTFEQSYLNELNKSSGTSSITGDFYVEGKINLSKLDEAGKMELTTADKKYQLDFGSDALAKYAEIEVDKKCITDKVVTINDEDYLKYTITVTTKEDKCPNVSVVDKFISNSKCVACYVGITETKTALNSAVNEQNPVEIKDEGKNAGYIYLGNTAADNTKPGVLSGTKIETPPGSMVWEIGDMEPHETRTLTYYVKLKKNVPLNNKEIKNNAQIFCKEQPRDSQKASFTPTLNYDTWNMKALGESGVVRNNDGTYTISYKLNFNLYEDGSNYPLRNFEFLDYLDHANNPTDSTVRRYVDYNNDVKLYKVEADGNNQVNDSAYQVKWSTDGSAYDKFENVNNPTSFKVSGTTEKPLTINPGEHYYVTYSVTVKPEALAAMKKDNVEIKNRMIVAASNADKENMRLGFEAYNHKETIGNYKWNEKTVSSVTNANQTFTMNDDIYDLTLGEGIQKDTSGSKSFEVPAGSYPYTVDVNQTKGDWDATEVTMKDTLKSDKMQYVGYAKVEAYKYNSTTDKYETLVGTKWVKIDGLNSFKLTPSQLEWKNNRYAYKFTYYAKPVNQDTFSSAKVQNSFEISGNVGNGTSTIDISTIESQKEITISGSFNMNVRKTSWYYEKPEIDAQTWENGKLYWVIEVGGTALLKDTSFRDWISKDSGLKDSYLHEDSLVGIYKGKLPEGKQITEYNSVEELKAKENLEDVTTTWFSEKKLTNEKNFPGDGNYSELTVTAKDTHQLKGNKLYFIVRTEPQSLPINDRDTYKYKNHVSTQDKGEALVEQDSAEKELYKAPNILKELGQTFTYDKTKKEVTNVSEGADGTDTSKISTSELDKTTGSGQYISWAVKLNYAGEMSGKYRVLETIPDGMELSYIRIKWIASGTITSNQISNLSDWAEKSVTATDDNSISRTTYYYVKRNQALIELGDFVAGKQRDQNAVDVQVVCRVTDPDVLLKGDAKEFVNRVELQTEKGETIDVATSPATITPKKLEKTCVKANQNITFTIKANQLGETLPTVDDSKKVKLMDQLSDTLILDPKTIQVVNSNDNSKVEFKASLKDDNTLEIEIPCNIPVTITYTATVNAPPDEKVSFSNVVYWERYTPSNGTKVEEGDYSYSAGGTVSGETNMKLIISKVDQNNTSVLLSGATFQVVNCKRDANGDIKEVEDENRTGTTGADGKVTFGGGVGKDYLMEFNTIYKVTETDAPDGYVVNSEPIYIMVPKKEGTPAAYSSDVQECIKDKRIRKLYDAIYNLTVTNHKGEITVEKKFKNPGGHDSNPVSGTYRFGLYENQEATGAQIQKIQITYSAGETDTKKNKFVDLELGKTYYVFELDDEGRPIKDSSTVAIVNGMEYFTSYATTKTGATEPNSATNGDKVTVTNQSRVNKLPSTGSCGVLIYRLAGAILILFAGVLMLMKYKETKTRN